MKRADNAFRWIAALMKARKCDAHFASRVFQNDIAPVLNAFPPELLDEPAPKSIIAAFADMLPRRKRLRWRDLLGETLLRGDFAVSIDDGNIAFTRTHAPAPKRFAIARFSAKQTDGRWRLTQVGFVRDNLVMEEVEGHWRMKAVRTANK